jgi:hypothetical protein
MDSPTVLEIIIAMLPWNFTPIPISEKSVEIVVKHREIVSYI